MMEDSGKTIFILINRSFLIRNILRSGTLAYLKKAGHRIVIFFASEPVPRYLYDEFEDDQVTIYGLKVQRDGKFRRKFNKIKRYVIITRNVKYNISHTKEFENNGETDENGIISRKTKAQWKVYIELAIAYILSATPIFKVLLRWGEPVLFPEKNERVKAFFDMHKPDLVFSTSSGGTFEYPFIKEARRRKVATASMPKSWDNINNEFIPLVPDHFIAQNNETKECAMRIQRIPSERISVVGMPHFDWYRRDEIMKTRGEYLRDKGLDRGRATIFFGSEGFWAPNDHHLAEKIHEWIVNDELIKPCQLLARAHYSNVQDDVFKNLRGKEHVVVDDYRIIDFFVDKWDQNIDETIDFVNSVAHADVMISIASSLSLDAASKNTPSISPAFGGEYEEGRDVTDSKLYSTDHLHWLMSSGGVWKARSYEELKEAINTYLEKPELHQREREQLLEKLCYKVDGRSSERLSNVLGTILNRT